MNHVDGMGKPEGQDIPFQNTVYPLLSFIDILKVRDEGIPFCCQGKACAAYNRWNVYCQRS
jgi:hypothetical protein